MLQWFDNQLFDEEGDYACIIFEAFAPCKSQDHTMENLTLIIGCLLNDISTAYDEFCEDITENCVCLKWSLLFDVRQRPHDALQWQQALHQWLDTHLNTYMATFSLRSLYFRLSHLVSYVTAQHIDTLRQCFWKETQCLTVGFYDTCDVEILSGWCRLLNTHLGTEFWNVWNRSNAVWNETHLLELLHVSQCQLKTQSPELINMIHTSLMSYLPTECDRMHLRWMRDWFTAHADWGYDLFVPLVESELLCKQRIWDTQQTVLKTSSFFETTLIGTRN
jgi:hypothetical protein